MIIVQEQSFTPTFMQSQANLARQVQKHYQTHRSLALIYNIIVRNRVVKILNILQIKKPVMV